MKHFKKTWGILSFLLLMGCYPAKYTSLSPSIEQRYKDMGLNCKTSMVVLKNKSSKNLSVNIDGILYPVEKNTTYKFNVKVKYNEKKQCIESSNIIQTFADGSKGSGTFRFRPCDKTVFCFD